MKCTRLILITTLFRENNNFYGRVLDRYQVCVLVAVVIVVVVAVLIVVLVVVVVQ